MAKFAKGNKISTGRPKGSPNKETKQLRQFLADVLDNNRDRFEQELANLKGKDYINAIAVILEYCTPKLQRTEHSGSIEQTEKVIFKIAGQEIPFENVRAN